MTRALALPLLGAVLLVIVSLVLRVLGRPDRRVARRLAMTCVAQLLGAVAIFTAGSTYAQESPLRLVQTIALPNVEGRIDHLAVDLTGQRLFVAALGNDTVEIVDLQAGTRVRSLKGFHEPQGVAFINGLGRLFVSNGGTGTVNSFNGETLQPFRTVKFSGDADNLRYDAAGQLYVGFGNGALGIVDAKDGKQMGELKLTGHPESFQLESAGARIFVNVPNANQVAVVDRLTRQVLTIWNLLDSRANFPMALDETNHRLIVGCRQPPKLIIYDTESGKVVASLDSAGDADDLFYDHERKRIYLSGGEGFIEVFGQRDADHYTLTSKMPTAGGARTSLLVPPLGQYFLAVPHRGAQAAEIRVYRVQ